MDATRTYASCVVPRTRHIFLQPNLHCWTKTASLDQKPELVKFLAGEIEFTDR